MNKICSDTDLRKSNAQLSTANADDSHRKIRAIDVCSSKGSKSKRTNVEILTTINDFGKAKVSITNALVCNQPSGMVDVSDKATTKRTAMACASIIFQPDAFKKFKNQESPKGDVLETARTAGIMAAKATPGLLPLCHPLQLSKVRLQFDIDEKKYTITALAEVVCRGQTGVEMEALTAATVACLTIYDMMKWADPLILISEIKLLEKTGGRSGNFKRKP